MAKKAKPQETDKSFEGIEHALTRTEQFIEDNSKVLSYIVFGIILVVLIFMGVKRFYINPLEEEAAGQMFMAERFFDRDSFDLALNGYGTYPGFLQIIEDYGITKSANLAQYYAGVSYLSIQNYEEAIDYLKDFDTDDVLLGSAKYSSLGDAYTSLNEFDQAESAYSKGIDKFKNDFSTPVMLKKLGLVYEETQKYQEAIDTYKSISKNYPESTEARDIQKYIARAELRTKE